MKNCDCSFEDIASSCYLICLHNIKVTWDYKIWLYLFKDTIHVLFSIVMNKYFIFNFNIGLKFLYHWWYSGCLEVIKTFKNIKCCHNYCWKNFKFYTFIFWFQIIFFCDFLKNFSFYSLLEVITCSIIINILFSHLHIIQNFSRVVVMLVKCNKSKLMLYLLLDYTCTKTWWFLMGYQEKFQQMAENFVKLKPSGISLD